MNKFLILMGVILLAIGVTMIYDARPMVKEHFNFGKENEAVLGMKILGFVLAMIGGILLYFNF